MFIYILQVSSIFIILCFSQLNSLFESIKVKIPTEFQSVFTSRVDALQFVKISKVQCDRDGNMDTIMEIFCYSFPTTSYIKWELVETTATAFSSSSLVGSFKHCKYLPTCGFQISIKIQHPLTNFFRFFHFPTLISRYTLGLTVLYVLYTNTLEQAFEAKLVNLGKTSI